MDDRMENRNRFPSATPGLSPMPKIAVREMLAKLTSLHGVAYRATRVGSALRGCLFFAIIFGATLGIPPMRIPSIAVVRRTRAIAPAREQIEAWRRHRPVVSRSLLQNRARDDLRSTSRH